MRVILISCFCISLLCLRVASGKIIINTFLWQPTTCIYQINTQLRDTIQIIEFRPQEKRLWQQQIISIDLPKEITAIQDTTILFGEQPILFALTTTGQLLGINLLTQRIIFIEQLAEYFGKTNNYIGTLSIAYGQDEKAYLLATVNALYSGIILLTMPTKVPLFSNNNITDQLKIILAPATVFAITKQVKMVINKETNKIFIGAQLFTGDAIWEVDLNDNITHSNEAVPKLYKIKTGVIKDFLLLDLQRKQKLDVFAVYSTNWIQFLPYANASNALAFSIDGVAEYIQGTNIKHILIGPGITKPLLSWYIINKNTMGYYLTSNNFPEAINLPLHNQIFLRHGELIFHSLDSDQVFTINAKTGNVQQSHILYQYYTEVTGAADSEAKDFLFWDPVDKQHVLLSVNIKHSVIHINVKHFTLSFDKPKLLSWRQKLN